MLGSAPVVSFLATARPAEALAFYRDVLGLRFIEETPFALVFATARTILRIQKVARVAAPPYTALGFQVPDIEAAVRGLMERGVSFERYPGLDADTLAIWQSPAGAKVAWFRDPDGNLLSVSDS